MEWLQEVFASSGAVIGGGLGVVGFFLMIAILRSFIRAELPDNVIVVTGRKRVKDGKTFGFSVERGRTTKVPYFQSVGTLDLGVYPINVRVEGVNSANGITVGADATACVCIDDDDEGMLYSAVERLMGKDREQVQQQIQQTLIGNFRGALNKATPLQAIGMEDSWKEESDEDESEGANSTEVVAEGLQGERAMFRSELFADINSDLSSFGMKVVSVSLQKIWDTSNYIANLAQKTLAQKRQQVEIEEARLRARAEQSESDSQRRIEIAKSQADEKIIAAREKLEMYRRESTAQIEQTRLEAENGIEEAKNRSERAIQERLVALQELKNQTGVTLVAKANETAAITLSEGDEASVRIVEETRNEILSRKVSLLKNAGNAGRSVLFMQQQLPRLFEAYRKYAENINVDSLVIMDDETGFNGAVNRGPAAFVDFLAHFNEALGVDVREFLNSGDEIAVGGGE
jgi:flotillin